MDFKIQKVTSNLWFDMNAERAVLFIINCESQDEVDYYWDKMTEGGSEKAQEFSWLKDRFGFSWQVVPIELNEMLAGAEAEQSGAGDGSAAANEEVGFG